MNTATLPHDVLAAIAGGYHRDAFGVLGPQAVDDGLAIRTFQPQAAEVQLVERGQGGSWPLRRIHPDGIFELVLPDRQLPLDYQLQLTLPGGDQVTIEDPYRFPSAITDLDAYLLGEGSHTRMYEKLGAHLMTLAGHAGVHFAVWAPNALRVGVVGNFNQWDGRRHVMRFHPTIGIWEIFMPGVGEGELYKYEIKTYYHGYMVTKSDPVGFFGEMRPNTASVVWDLDKYEWGDADWLESGRAEANRYDAPISIYEVHLGSWKLKDGWEWLTYAELAEQLIPYVKELGYTHIELMPVAEHPFDGSWGYQVTGYFAVTSRFGTPEEFMAFVDACHQAGIGVILDWVPGHFPKDQHGLGFFDGTYLYEHADPRRGEHPDWGTLIFNYGRNEVRQFLISNAYFWVEKYHIDGLRVDAVASMLYLDFSREAGQWLPNQYGGRENLEAIAFIKEFNGRLHQDYPHVLTIAEESTAYPAVTHPLEEGGLGFDLKWNMGWMNDTLRYMGNDPVYRSFHQGSLTFSLMYAFSERFLLPFSHDEVVHLKRSMLDKMPGDVWRRFANLRLLYGYQYGHPGRKLLFMGGEFGQWREWSEARSLDWSLLEQDEKHGQMQKWVAALNRLYQAEPALHRRDDSWDGFMWLDFRDAWRSILAFARQAPVGEEGGATESVLVACNFTPVVRHQYRLGVPEPGVYRELLNSDAAEFGGSGVVNGELMASEEMPFQDQPYSIQLTLPPLGAVFLKRQA